MKTEWIKQIEDMKSLLEHASCDLDYVRSYPHTAREWLRSTEATIERAIRMTEKWLGHALAEAEIEEAEAEDFYAAECDENDGEYW